MAVGRIQVVPGQFFASINFHGLGFIREYANNAKIRIYTVYATVDKSIIQYRYMNVHV